MYMMLLHVPPENFDAATLEADLTSDSEFSRFKEAARHSNLVPLYERVFADQLTPVTAYRCLVAEDDREAPSFLFESVVNGTQTVSCPLPDADHPSHCHPVSLRPDNAHVALRVSIMGLLTSSRPPIVSYAPDKEK